MEKYSSYKDSGEKWLGMIPEHWDCLPMKYSVSINNGRDYKHIVSEQGYPVIGSGGQFAFASEYMYDGEVVFFGRKGTVDKPLYFKGKFWAVDTMFYAIPKENIVGKYLYYQAQTLPYMLYSTSTALPSMTQTDLGNFKISLPPLPEQRAIVSYLDRVTGEIDRAIVHCEQLISLLNERKQIIIQQAVTKGLDPNAPLKYSGVDWIGNVPVGWECLPMKFVFEMRNGYTPSKNDPSFWTNGTIPWYRMEDIRKSGRFLNESIQKVTQKAVNGKGVFSAGSYIMAICTASIGEHAMLIVDSQANQQFANFKIRKSLSDRFLPMYLYYYFFVIGDFCRNNANSTCFQYVDMSALKNLPIAVPNMEEQQSIVSYLDENLQTLSQAIASTERKIALLRERKQIIINEVVTGKVKVV